MPERRPRLPCSLREAVDAVCAPFGKTMDLMIRRLSLGPADGVPAALIYCEGLVDRPALEQHVIAALQRMEFGPLTAGDLLRVASRGLSLRQAKRAAGVRRIVQAVAAGHAVLLCDGAGAALLLDVAKGPGRQVDVSELEPVIKGPREAFVENLGTNIAMLRRILSDPRLRFESFTAGQVTHTPGAIAYFEGQVDRRVLARVRHGLRRIRVQKLLGSRQMEEALTRGRWVLLPITSSTERPDRVVAALLEGRVVILIQGTPNAIIVPVTFWHLIQSPEDYYTVPQFATFTRIMRVLGSIAVLALPSFYIALTSYHLELLPTVLALSMNVAHAGVPFPGLVEAFLMELIFEAVREAGIRLPKPAGQAVTIVGGLIIGQAAIEARLVSPMMVIVVAATGVASFTLPSYPLAVSLRTLRFFVMLFSGFLGLFGFMTAMLAVLLYVSALRSVGRPFLAPLAPYDPTVSDVLVRRPQRPDALRRGGHRRRR